MFKDEHEGARGMVGLGRARHCVASCQGLLDDDAGTSILKMMWKFYSIMLQLDSETKYLLHSDTRGEHL